MIFKGYGHCDQLKVVLKFFIHSKDLLRQNDFNKIFIIPGEHILLPKTMDVFKWEVEK